MDDRTARELARASIEHVVAREHRNGAILHALGLSRLTRRVFGVIVDYNGYTFTGYDFPRFVQSLYRQGGQRPQTPDFPNAIALSFPSKSSDEWAAPSYITLDTKMSDSQLSLIVPQGDHVPYSGTGRSETGLDSLAHLPFWAVSSDGLGVSVDERNVQGLQFGGEKIMHLVQGVWKPRTSVKLIVKWPGYDGWKTQIQLKRTKAGEAGESYTYERLVNQINSRIRLFLDRVRDKVCQDRHWRVGESGRSRISAEDLVLLAFVFVSEGAVMPILKLRDGFDFNTYTAFPFPQAYGVAPLPSTVPQMPQSFLTSSSLQSHLPPLSMNQMHPTASTSSSLQQPFRLASPFPAPAPGPYGIANLNASTAGSEYFTGFGGTYHSPVAGPSVPDVQRGHYADAGNVADASWLYDLDQPYDQPPYASSSSDARLGQSSDNWQLSASQRSRYHYHPYH